MIRRYCCLILCALLLTGSSHAIIIRHDVSPASYEVRPSQFPAVFFIERQGNRKVCAATVIHPQWALTAAHCADETMLAATIANGRRFAVEVANQTREIDLLIVHPDYDVNSASDVDLALVRFSLPATIPRPMPLQTDENELGQVVSLIGWGYFGLGTTGRQYDDGRFRRAQNRIVRADNRLRVQFDDPRRDATLTLQLEGMPGLGDSGGPALLETPTGQRLTGIAVGEVVGVDFSEETQGKYGSVAVYERVSQHIDWIETVIGSSLPFDS
jgi:secreted trypsin-like serine protease